MPDEPTLRAERLAVGRRRGRCRSATSSQVRTAWSTGCGRAGAASLQRGLTRDDLARIVADYQREIWFWLAGERTWAQCCSGLIGRITRRLGEHAEA